MRGFDGGGIGPRDTGNAASVGGNNYYAGSFEIVSDMGFTKDLGMRWTVYTDYGSVWGTDYPAGVTGANDYQCVHLLVLYSVGHRYWSTVILLG